MHVCLKWPFEKKYLQFFVFVFNFPATCFIRILSIANNGKQLKLAQFLKKESTESCRIMAGRECCDGELPKLNLKTVLLQP